MQNRANDPNYLSIITELKQKLAVFKTCKGNDCWIHSFGNFVIFPVAQPNLAPLDVGPISSTPTSGAGFGQRNVALPADVEESSLTEEEKAKYR